MTQATTKQINAAFDVLRKGIDSTGWGGWVSNDKLLPWARDAANAVAQTAPPNPAPAPQPQPPTPSPSAQDTSSRKGEQK